MLGEDITLCDDKTMVDQLIMEDVLHDLGAMKKLDDQSVIAYIICIV